MDQSFNEDFFEDFEGGLCKGFIIGQEVWINHTQGLDALLHRTLENGT